MTETLGYSDAFLLDEIVYAPLRLLGAEPLLALTLTAIVLSLVAYFFAYLAAAVRCFGAISVTCRAYLHVS